FDNKGKMLLFATTTDIDSTGVIEISLLKLATGEQHKIWTSQPGDKIADFHFSDNGKQVLFTITKRKNGEDLNSIWLYRSDEEKTVLKLKDGDPRIDNRRKLDVGAEFSKNGKWIFFTLRQPVETPKLTTNAAQV